MDKLIGLWTGTSLKRRHQPISSDCTLKPSRVVLSTKHPMKTTKWFQSLLSNENSNKQASRNVATENQQEIDAIKASRGRLVMMMERKRKAASEPSEETQVTRAPLSPPIETHARAPSSIGNHERWSWKDDVVAVLVGTRPSTAGTCHDS